MKVLFVFLAVFLMGICPVSGEEQKQAGEKQFMVESIGDGSGRKGFSLDLKKGIVIYGGGVRVTTDGVSLRCRDMVLFRKTREIYAEGEIILTDGDIRITAERIYYNFKKHNGVLEEARIVSGLKRKGSSVEWVVFAKRLIRKKRDFFRAESAYVTTCSFKEPHYRLQCSSVDIEPGRQIRGRNMVLYLGSVPVFYYPYFRHDLKHDWLPYDFDLGNTSTLGDYLKTAWKIYSNDYINFLLLIHMTEKRGNPIGVDFEYGGSSDISGLVHYYLVNDPVEGGIKRQRVTWDHYQNPGNSESVLKSKGYSYSDRTFGDDFFDSEYRDQLEYTPYLQYRHLMEQAEFDFYYSRRLDTFQTAPFYTPAVLFRIGPEMLFRDLHLNIETFAAESGIMYDDLTGPDTLEREKFDTRLDLTYRTEAGPIAIDLSCGEKMAWYSEYITEVDNRLRHQSFAGVRFGTSFTGDFNVDLDPLDIRGLHHIIEPYISFNREYEPSIDNSYVEQIDLMDNLYKDRYIETGISSSLKTMRDGNLQNLLFLKGRFRYYDDKELAKANNEGEQWDDIEFIVRADPLNELMIYSSGEFDPGEFRFQKFYTGISYDMPGRLGIHARDFRAESSRSQTFGLELAASRRWSMAGFMRYDAAAEKMSDWSIAGTRVFHMWRITFKTEYDLQDDETSFGFKLDLLDKEGFYLPDPME